MVGTRSTLGTVSRIFGVEFASVYPLYIAKVERKGRTKAELDEAIIWLTGFDESTLRRHAGGGVTFEQFFAEAPMNPNASLITGVVCGVRVETIEDPRCGWKVEHRLLDILVIAVRAVLGEAESFPPQTRP